MQTGENFGGGHFLEIDEFILKLTRCKFVYAGVDVLVLSLLLAELDWCS